MAHTGKTAHEFIQSSFSPVVAVLNAPKVDSVVSKNNLSFVELLQPFTSFDWHGQFREPNGTVCIVKNLKVVVRDVNWKPLQPTEARRQLNNAVLHNHTDKTVTLELDGRKLSIPQSTNWFDMWRETYLEVQFPSDHEYTKHFLSCMLVGSTLDDNIVETFNSLNEQFIELQNVTPPKLPKWFSSNVLKSYVLLHDAASAPKEKADVMFETMKQQFEAANCFMLSINSRSTTDQMLAVDHWAPFIKRSDTISDISSTNLATTPMDPQSGFEPPTTEIDSSLTASTYQEVSHPLTTSEHEVYDKANSLQTHSFSGSSESMNLVGRLPDASTEVHGAALSSHDVDAIKKFIQEYTTRALLPYVERQITVLTEAVANRKGVSRSLLSATKRWFGTGKGGNTTASNTVIYSSECPELQLRRLADLWFMFGQWQRAFDTYHTAKREFYADGAWLCYAGALEMAGLSAFMAGDTNKKTHGYMEESIVTYLNTCRMVQYAVRATLLSAACLREAGLPGDAAKQLIRMTSEDSDLRSAVLLEQAALCFLAGPGARPMCRKYAFHMVLAGHRFSKAGQKKHAYRCYLQAYQVYGESGWRLSTEHVQLALGRLAGALRAPRAAAAWLSAPLAPRASLAPPHPAHTATHHRNALRDYMMAHQQMIESQSVVAGCATSLSVLPVPGVERGGGGAGGVGVACGGHAPLSAPGRVAAAHVALPDALRRASTAADDAYWHKMEEMLVLRARRTPPVIFRPSVLLYTAKTDDTPTVPQGEPIQISITLRNPLKVALTLADLELLWRFQASVDAPDQPEWLSNEPALAAATAIENNVIFGQKIQSAILDAESTDILTFTITPLHVGQLVVYGLSFTLISHPEENEGGKVLTISGKLSLEYTDDKSSQAVLDKCLQITVTPCAPCLQMTFSETSPAALSGELRSVDVEFRNVGPVEMCNLHVAVSHPDAMQLLVPGDAGYDFRHLIDEKYCEIQTQAEERGARAAAWRAAAARHTWRLATPHAHAPLRARLLLRPRAHAQPLYLLAYYEPPAAAAAGTPHRLLRHVFNFNVTEAVEVVATPRRCVGETSSESELPAEKLSFVLEVKNLSEEKSDLSVEVLEASLLSRQWQLHKLVTARDKQLALNPRERIHLILEASRIKETVDKDKLHASSLKICSGNPMSEPDVTSPPYSKFVVEYRATPMDDESFLMKGSRTRGLIESTVVVRWRAGGALGQHCVWINCFPAPSPRDGPHPPHPLESRDVTDIQGHPLHDKDNVIFKMDHANYVKHNFEESQICVVPVTINVINCYSVPVQATIELSKNTAECGAGWCGALAAGAGGAAGGRGAVRVCARGREARRVSARALLAAPGTYLLAAAVQPAAPAPTAPTGNTSLLVVEHCCN